MQIEFQYQNPIHVFKLSGAIHQLDCSTLLQSLQRFYQNKTAGDQNYVVLDLSQLAENEMCILDSVIREIQFIAQSQGHHLFIARTLDQAQNAFSEVLELALNQKSKVLTEKDKIKSEMKTIAVKLFEENDRLKNDLKKAKIKNKMNQAPFVKFLDRIWGSE